MTSAQPFRDNKVSTRALGAELANLWKADARFVAKRGRWYFWNGSSWERDGKLLHMTRAREFMRAKAEERPDKARTLGNPPTLKAVLWFAGSLLVVAKVADLGAELP